jgi:hypothetical protein
MQDPTEQRLQELSGKLEQLSMQHQHFAQEIRQLRAEIQQLSLGQNKPEVAFPEIKKTEPARVVPEPTRVVPEPARVVIAPPVSKPVVPPPVKSSGPKQKTPLEEFIGTNLLNKIGIAVLVFGLAIGAKYAIDHELISPLTRIVLGYFAGIILIGLAIRLKQKYHGFSAVLLSGGMAVLYFMTYAAYSFYDLIPQPFCFILMVVFTAFTVFASLQYDLKAIAIIGLVGAYAVPFLLSDGSGRVAILFSYMIIVNTGILVLSFRKAWKVLYYTAFALTWLIFSAWFFDQYYVTDHLWISLGFSTVFFITFYITFLSYKLLQGEPLKRRDIVILLFNSFIYYGFGYAAINDHEQGGMFLGIFTVFNAILHFTACYIIYKKQDATRDTFYFVAGMVLVFLTLAVPVQLDGHWVTLVWAAEAVLLFWIGRSKSFPVYERLSYTLILLTLFSLLEDWQRYYPHYYNQDNITTTTFLLNIQFLSSLLICASWGWILYIGWRNKPAVAVKHWLTSVFEWGLPIMLILILYVSFYNEIDAYWQQRYFASAVKVNTTEQEYEYNIYDNDLQHFGRLWLMIYSAAFLGILWFSNRRWIRNTYLTHAVTGSSAVLILSFVTAGLYGLSVLRNSYLYPENAQYYFRDYGHILIRYISLAAILPLLWIIYKNVQEEKMKETTLKAERVFFHLVILLLLSSELISTLDLTHIEGSDRLALSILWGVYALGLIVYGLVKDKQFIRITAISIFGVTLIKLFFYDMAAMSTISKTIVMVILGALLLIASFIYNKFKASRNQHE